MDTLTSLISAPLKWAGVNSTDKPSFKNNSSKLLVGKDKPLYTQSVNHRTIHCIKNGRVIKRQWVNRSFVPRENKGRISSTPKEWTRADKKAWSQYHHEYQIMVKLSHNNCIAYKGKFDVLKTQWPSRKFATHAGFYLRMEYGGQPLMDTAHKQRFTSKRYLQAVMQGLEGLQHMHNKKLVHQDFKLENLVITTKNKKDTVKLIDFEHAFEKKESHTRPRIFGGTAGYMAPENKQQERVSTASDVYSAGFAIADVLQRQGLIGKLVHSADPLIWTKPNLIPTEKGKQQNIEPLLKLVKAMLTENPANRPSLEQVIPKLYEAIDNLPDD